MMSTVPPKAFVLDFDGTITTKDTISNLANFGIKVQRERGNDLTPAWDEILRRYGEDFSKHTETYRPLKENRTSLEEEIEYYRSLKDAEIKSFARVSTSAIFKDIETEQWHAFGSHALANGEVMIRSGFKDFIDRIGESRATWGVVSVNFSVEFIRGILAATIGPLSADVEILANQADEEGILKGPQIKGRKSHESVMATSDAKLAAMKDLIEFWGSSGNVISGGVVYIGDSGTDVECLTMPGVTGIVISEDGSSSLIETLHRIGIQPAHIKDYAEEEKRSMYWAREFGDLLDSDLFPSQ
jgi:2-hydroxy-3-keto-5-methylthiopentenyl-1-phosphate phosphatase